MTLLLNCRARRALATKRAGTRASAVITLLVSAFLMVGCDRRSGNESAAAGGTPSTRPAAVAPSTAPTPTKVKIGYVGLTCEAPLFVAYEKGFYKEEGL